MGKLHRYSVEVRWTGNTGTGTSTYRSYERAHEITGDGKPQISGSSDPTFRGDRSRWNPEELLLAALSACHQLSYLHLCAVAGIVVLEYVDKAQGEMLANADGSGEFERVILKPWVRIAAGGDLELARKLHEDAHGKCFIARSMNFPVLHEAEVVSG